MKWQTLFETHKLPGTTHDSEVVPHPDVDRVLRTPGQLLDSATRAFMEPLLGHDFSQVRVHTDAKAAESARAVNALAYTVGRDVVFGPGQYAPETRQGRMLLAHELAHVIQGRPGVYCSDEEEDKKTPEAAKTEKPLLVTALAPEKKTQTPAHQGHVLVGAAAQTPIKSVGQYGEQIIRLLEKDKKRTLSIQDIVRKASQAKGLEHVRPTTAEVGTPRRGAEKGNRLALIVANSDYQEPNTDLPRSKREGRQMQALLKARKHSTQLVENKKAVELSKELDTFIASAKAGDDAIIFYTGHGDTQGMQGVDNQFVTPSKLAESSMAAFNNGFELTLIVESCHAGAVSDYIRKEESTRIQKVAHTGSKSKAEALSKIAAQLQGIKDELAKLERSKQAIMEDEARATKLSAENKLGIELQKKDTDIKAAWDNAMPRIQAEADKVQAIANERLPVPLFVQEPGEWLNTKEMSVLDSMTNRVLELAREAL